MSNRMPGRSPPTCTSARLIETTSRPAAVICVKRACCRRQQLARFMPSPKIVKKSSAPSTNEGRFSPNEFYREQSSAVAHLAGRLRRSSLTMLPRTRSTTKSKLPGPVVSESHRLPAVGVVRRRGQLRRRTFLDRLCRVWQERRRGQILRRFAHAPEHGKIDHPCEGNRAERVSSSRRSAWFVRQSRPEPTCRKPPIGRARAAIEDAEPSVTVTFHRGVHLVGPERHEIPNRRGMPSALPISPSSRLSKLPLTATSTTGGMSPAWMTRRRFGSLSGVRSRRRSPGV